MPSSQEAEKMLTWRKREHEKNTYSTNINTRTSAPNLHSKQQHDERSSLAFTLFAVIIWCSSSSRVFLHVKISAHTQKSLIGGKKTKKTPHTNTQPNRRHKRLKSDNLSLYTTSLHKFRKRTLKQTDTHTVITLLICMYPRLICASYYPSDNRRESVCVCVWGGLRQTNRECCVHLGFCFMSPDVDNLLTWFP